MYSSIDGFKRILKFWSSVEAMGIPSTPKVSNNVYCYSGNNDKLPWENESKGDLKNDGNSDLEFIAYIGIDEIESFVKQIFCKFNITEISEGELERLYGDGWISAIKLDSLGRYKVGSSFISSFAIGYQKLVNNNKDLANLDKDFQSFNQKFESKIIEICKGQDDELLPFDLKRLKELSGSVFELSGFELSKKCKFFIKKLNSKSNEDSDFLNSFYLNDIDKVLNEININNFGEALKVYLSSSTNSPKKDILKNKEFFKECLRPEMLPLGRWPSNPKYHLMLAQQAAVFKILSLSESSGLISVNGPPGTGKTTLLQDVIADIIVQRASKLSKLKNPYDIFDKDTTLSGKKAYPLKKWVMDGMSIVVTSNNNSAVENITKELPSKAKIDDKTFSNASYFTQICKNIFKEDNDIDTENNNTADENKNNIGFWGLISVPLGNSANRGKFAESMYDDSESVDSDNVYTSFKGYAAYWKEKKDEALKEFENYKYEFEKLKSEIESIKSYFVKASEKIAEEKQLQSRLVKIDEEIRKLKDEMNHVQDTIEKVDGEIIKNQSDIDVLNVEIRSLDLKISLKKSKKPNFLVRLFKTSVFKLWQKEIDDLILLYDKNIEKLKEANNAKQKLEKEKGDLEKKKKELNSKIKEKEEEKNKINSELDHIRNIINDFKNKNIFLPDEVLNDNNFHLSSVWVNEYIDTKRSELFLCSLKLIESIVKATVGRWDANFKIIKDMLKGSCEQPLNEEQIRMVWDMIFFIVPVVSTTLASFSRLFKGMGRESIGWLLVDEAGQTTPQSLVGAVWRSKRVVIIGDPLQIEPVFTVPSIIVSKLKDYYRVEDIYSPLISSAQSLADQSMEYGSAIGDTWTGMPLRAHRRCIDPMFAIANKIAYENQMVQANKSVPEFECILGESGWFDIKGQRFSQQVVEEELNFFERMFSEFKRKLAKNKW